MVTIQAVLAKDLYQDVAVIDVVRDVEGETQVQIVGDVYMYGPGYIITPVYVRPPVVVGWFWGSHYDPWYSPYYYGYYPPYYRTWRPYPAARYRTNVHVHVNVNNSYHRTTVRKSKTTVALQNKSRRNDFGSKNPDKSYTKRHDNPKSNVKDNKTSAPSNKSNAKPTSKPENKSTTTPAKKPKKKRKKD